MLSLAGLNRLQAQVTVNYTYDNPHLLTEAWYGNDTVIQYSYDVLGNMTQEVQQGVKSIEKATKCGGL